MRVLCLCLALSLTAACARPNKFMNVTYKEVNGDKLKLDVRVPEGDGPFPVVFTVHGGSWQGGSRKHMTNIAYKLAKEGFAVINISYRLGPESHYPAPIEDLTDALKWAKDHEAQYHLDFTKVNFWGYSAGSQVAALTALKLSEVYPIKAIINGAGPLNFELYPNDKTILKYLGSNNLEALQTASVYYNLSKHTPPIFSYHSTNDQIVDIRHSETLHEKLTTLGVENKLHKVPLLGHILTFLFSCESIDLAAQFLKIHNGMTEY
jgi:acetyl esterase/lipase